MDNLTKLKELNRYGHDFSLRSDVMGDDEDGYYAKCSRCGAVENTEGSVRYCPYLDRGERLGQAIIAFTIISFVVITFIILMI